MAGTLATRLAKEVEAGGLAEDGEAWLKQAREAVLARLDGGAELSAQELREQVPELAGAAGARAGQGVRRQRLGRARGS